MDNNPSVKSEWSEYILVNIIEEIVRDKTKKMMETMEMCTCEKCYLDACAIALNSLHQMYVTTHRGALLSQIDTVSVNYQAEMTVAIVKALKMVKQSPRH